MSFAAIASATVMLVGLLISSGDAQNLPIPHQTPGVMEIDHIIVAVSNLELGISQFEELTGVRPVYGGQHPGAGTQNALVALGPRLYLEILAPQAHVELPETMAWLLALDVLKPMGFAVSTTDMAGTVALLQNNGYATSNPSPGSRSRPDGATLMWSSMDIADPLVVGAPFFIQWDASSTHPATTSPKGCALRSLAVVSPEQPALDRLFEVLGLAVPVEGGTGPEAAYQIAVDCPNGTVLLK